jgi:hypothetical protein
MIQSNLISPFRKRIQLFLEVFAKKPPKTGWLLRLPHLGHLNFFSSLSCTDKDTEYFLLQFWHRNS